MAEKPKKKSQNKIYEDNLASFMENEGFPPFVRDERFHDTRLWRFDFQWPMLKIALEFEGAIFAGGRHTRGSGFDKDCDKYNEATRLGWKVYRVTAPMMKDGRAADLLHKIFPEVLKKTVGF